MNDDFGVVGGGNVSEASGEVGVKKGEPSPTGREEGGDTNEELHEGDTGRARGLWACGDNNSVDGWSNERTLGEEI